MKEDKLSNLSMQLSVDVLRLTKELKVKHETIISNQICRSSTSVCANIVESKYGHSRADFIANQRLFFLYSYLLSVIFLYSLSNLLTFQDCPFN